MINATPTKLRNGDWGAKVQGSVSEGDYIQITTRAGKSWGANVARVIWRGDGVSIVATMALLGESRGRSRRRDPDYCYHSCPVNGHTCSPENGPCHDCE